MSWLALVAAVAVGMVLGNLLWLALELGLARAERAPWWHGLVGRWLAYQARRRHRRSGRD